jgi:tetratricopeptide (TPR) repeat protein
MGDPSYADARSAPELGLPERYEPLRHIATGGMASVWCARDRALGRNVAIKLLAERFADDDDATDRFMREGRAAARLSGHPNVVMIYDVGETEAVGIEPPRAFLVMEYLAGGTVADALRVDSVRRVHAVKWLHEASSAVDYAHSRGVLHRDIKPANLLLDRDRTLHVADFGIARLGTEDTITGTGQVLGTASYLAPERALGRPATDASDRYSLAVVAYELLVGERPFTAQHFAAQARQHVEDAPPAASERNRALPPAVDAALARGMAKRPEQRWASAQEFAAALESALREPATRPLRTVAAARPVAAARAASGAGAPRGASGVAAARAASGVAAARAASGVAAARAASATRPGVAAARAASATRPATRRAAPSPSAQTARPRWRGPRLSALAALAAGAVVAVAVIGTIGSGGGQPASSSVPAQRSTHPTAIAKRPPARAKPAATTTHTSSVLTMTQAAATTPPPVAATLEAQGHQLMVDGQYGAAIPVLRKAVAAASPGSLTYAYALYDLGRSLRLAGDPRDAAQVLWQRMQIPNQTGAVREQLQLALLALGQRANGGAPPAPGPAPPGGHHHGGPGGPGAGRPDQGGPDQGGGPGQGRGPGQAGPGQGAQGD